MPGLENRKTLIDTNGIYMGATKKGTIEEMKLLAKSRGGMCWSKIYTNCETKLWWECNKGHRWKSTPLSVKNRNSWCPFCARNRSLGIEEMQKIAFEHKGECLSKTYTNVKTKLLWKCNKGHQFEGTPQNIRKGRWCPYCMDKQFK